MKSIFEHFNSLKSQDWDYYGENNKNKLLESYSIKSKHIEFIKNYLKAGEKQDIFLYFDNFDIETFDRAIHTNGVFFLGCLFYKELNLKDNIQFKRSDEHDSFMFVWFLAALIHDVGYEVEKNFDEYKIKYTEYITSIKVENNLLDFTNDREKRDAYCSFDNEIKKLIDYIPNYYTEAYNGERSSNNKTKIEHGIYAGLKLYDGLVKNRINNKSLNLYSEKELEKFYAIASFSISIHNMRRDDIDNLDPDYKISLENEPFLFLFALADTIEPTKTYEAYYSKYVLENIKIQFKRSDKQG
jgi:hypothetical protein